MKPHHFALIFTLLSRLSTSSADTVLGGMVDYLPSCYKGQDAWLFVEYNAGACRSVPGPDKRNCPCISPHWGDSTSTPFLSNEQDHCVYTTVIDEYTVAANTPISSVSTDYPKYTQYYTGPFNTGASNSPVVQAINISGQSTHIAISLSKGLKMVRFRYLTDGQRKNWYRGVQLRFTNDFVQRLSQRDVGAANNNDVEFSSDLGMVSRNYPLLIDLECFYITAIIPYERRTEGHQMIDCVRLPSYGETSAATVYTYRIPWKENVADVASIENCEKGYNVQDVAIVKPREPMDVLKETLKNLAMAGVSFIPVVGPFLAIGVDLAYNVYTTYQDNTKGMDDFLKAEGVTTTSVTGALVLEKLKDAFLNRITKPTNLTQFVAETKSEFKCE
ncbi:hypothetical protein BGZ83_007283 [Gryganskiella cystojenkinii]|nr:hypothetical protein BGZ83_007283 [Gryganskiella cystojenkinii]